MTGEDFQKMRVAMGLSRNELAGMLGYNHADRKQDYEIIKRMEMEKRPISPMCERLVLMIYRDFRENRGWPDYDWMRAGMVASFGDFVLGDPARQVSRAR